MAIVKTAGREIVVEDGSSIIDAAKELDVPFSCHSGTCGTCRIEVLEGMENLTEKTPEEMDLGCTGRERQACQCRIKSGTVMITV